MILDSNLEFCDNEDVSASTGTEVIAAAIDLDAAGVRLGVGLPPFYLVIQVSVAFTSGTSSTVIFRLVSDSTDPASTDGTETIHWQSDTFADTALTKGKTLIVPLPSGGLSAYERYLQLAIVTGAAATTAGSINAFLTNDPANYYAYAEADS